jgi:cytochrome c oxidase cbb3-type subunit 4
MQGYAFFFFTIFLVVILYGYILHLYRSEKKGERDYEKYGKLALDDELTDQPVEANPHATNEKKKEK